MTCFYPLKGWRAKEVNPSTGKRKIVFSRQLGFVDQPVEVPCGQCSGCRLARSREWAIRCAHEASLHQENIFITLTYDDLHLPEDRSLNYRHFQLFMKRLLVYADRHLNRNKVRFYMCGEYGEQFGRPHYHACVFNLDLPDKKLWKTVRGNAIYQSEKLQEIWGHGYTSIGSVTFQSAAYVARYIMKKVTGDEAASHYEWIDPETGEVFQRKPEFTNMSRQPGIGRGWIDKYREDVFPHDYVVLKSGVKVSPPRFYTNQYELLYPIEAAALRLRRKQRAASRADNNTPDRLRVREKVLHSKLRQLKRTIE